MTINLRTVVHLVNGQKVDGLPVLVTEEEVKQAKDATAVLIADHPDYTLCVPREDGWAFFPGASILWVSLEDVGGDEEEDVF